MLEKVATLAMTLRTVLVLVVKQSRLAKQMQVNTNLVNRVDDSSADVLGHGRAGGWP